MSAASKNRSAATRLAISENNLRRSPELNARIAAANRGQKRSVESRKKMSDAHFNMSDETRLRMSVAGKNRKPPSDETRAKLSDALRRRHANSRLKKASDMLVVILTD